ncbi:MAG: restriction endonuclease subunit S [Candidatus Poribacteria bacterium]|nr:restriction endonuclease subunit S [Candidatus Poribacteria bacterium]
MSWNRIKLSKVATFRLGKMLDKKKNKGDFQRYLANVNVQWGKFVLDELREMRFEQHELEKFGLKYGDIVMCEGGEPGRCAIWKDQIPGMMIQKALHRIRPNDCLNTEFLYYTFLHHGKTNRFSKLFTGSTIKHLPREKLALVEIDVPPLYTQQKIASILSAYDDLIENNHRRIQLLEQSAQMLYKEWFVRLRFPGHEQVEIVDGVPEGWDKKTLAEKEKVRKGKNITQESAVEGNIPVVAGGMEPSYYHNTSNVSGPVITISASGANAGFVNIYYEDIWASDCSYINKESTIYFYFLYLTLKSRQKEIFNFQTGSAQPHVYPRHLEKLVLIFPPYRLSRFFEKLVSPNFLQIQILKRQNYCLAKARDLLLPRLMNGEIAV